MKTNPLTDAARRAAIAHTAVTTFNGIDAALSPIIGARGVAGLYKRSLSLTRVAHPILTAVYDGALIAGDYTALRRVLVEQSASAAASANQALLQTFIDLLTQLIGPSLTERLLLPVFANPSPSSSGDAVQDTSP